LRDLGITAFGTTTGPGGTSALLRIENFGGTAARSDIELFVEGQLADVRPISLSAGAESTQFWTGLPAHAGVLHATLTARDDVRTDKQAWALVSSGEVRRILLVTSSDYFLQTALTVDPSIQLSTVSPGNYNPRTAQRYDLVVFDGSLPASLPSTPVLLLSPPRGSVGPFTFERFVGAGRVADAPAPSADVGQVLQNVDVSDVHVARQRRATMPAWMTPLFTSGGHVLVAAGDNNGTRVAAGTFNLQESDWPLRISFPVLIQNLVHFLVPGVGVSSSSISAGDQISLSPEPGIQQIDITLPSGRVQRIGSPFPPFTNTSVPGVYTVREAGRSLVIRFVANLTPSRPSPAAGPADLVLGKGSGGTSKAVSSPNEVGWIVAILCLGLLSAEWWLAFKR
ncbi:MAG TPA: hypothetical protein VG815_16335, partial [Chloroflexota bacterium]|nr:hypothetical protein [Chloroflexota bacterium]